MFGGTHQMLEQGKILQERYRIERQVGQGGMGSVYLATDDRFHSTVAIKAAYVLDDNFKKAFAREARLLNSLKHSALPKVTDHFVEDNSQYLVMEYIGGDDLFEKMRKTGQPFPVESVLNWAEQLLDALEYLHNQGIVHRDIKPQNLKLTPEGKVILLDFGLAKGNPTDANYQTAAQSIFGYSRNYASLEQIQGTGTDPRSDVYSLAATIYHLMTARVPADALTRAMMVLNESRDPLEAAGSFNRGITKEISDALNVCMSLKAASRPGSAEEMRQLLMVDEKTSFESKGIQASSGSVEDLLTQETQVIEKPVDSAPAKQSEVKTEVMVIPSELLETDAAGAAKTLASNEIQPPKSSSFGYLGVLGVLGIIILVVGTVAGLVLYLPVSNGGPVLQTQPVQNDANIAVTSDAQVDSNGNSTVGDEISTEDLSNTAGDETGTSVADSKPGDSKPSASTQVEVQTPKLPTPAPTQNTKITASKTPVGKKPEVVKTPLPQPSRPPLGMTREQFNKLSPREKRRVRKLMENQQKPAGPPPPQN